MVKPSFNLSILDSGVNSAFENMEIDRKLLSDLAYNPTHSYLHFYDWQAPSATYGHFINPDLLLCQAGIKQTGLELARRPTGGGLIFHVNDFAFSVLLSASHPLYSTNTLDNYALINQMVVHVIQELVGRSNVSCLLQAEPIMSTLYHRHFCMAKPTKYDVMLNGLKIGGAAQRRTKDGLLHQSSICLTRLDSDLLTHVLLPNTGVQSAMKINSCALLHPTCTKAHLNQTRLKIRYLMQDYVT